MTEPLAPAASAAMAAAAAASTRPGTPGSLEEQQNLARLQHVAEQLLDQETAMGEMESGCARAPLLASMHADQIVKSRRSATRADTDLLPRAPAQDHADGAAERAGKAARACRCGYRRGRPPAGDHSQHRATATSRALLVFFQLGPQTHTHTHDAHDASTQVAVPVHV